jgi:hypothetical protein
MSERIRKLGWWAIPGEELLAMLRRVEQGERADVVYIEEYANCTRENLCDEDE